MRAVRAANYWNGCAQQGERVRIERLRYALDIASTGSAAVVTAVFRSKVIASYF